MIELMNKACVNTRADHLEARWFETVSSKIIFRNLSLKEASESLDYGGNVRAFAKGGVGFVTFTDAKKLLSCATEAVALAGTLNNAGIVPAESDPVSYENSIDFDEDPRTVSQATKLEIFRKYAEIIKSSDKRIISTDLSYSDRIEKRMYFDSSGNRISQNQVICSVTCSATAREGDKVRVYHDSFVSTSGFSGCRNLDAMMHNVGVEAVSQLEAEPVKAGNYPVVLDPRLAGTFIHEAFGHLCEADRVYRNPDLLKVMTINRPFGRPVLNVSDGGAYRGRYGSFYYDDEGIRSSITPLIREGRLSGRLHSRITAGMMNESPTGNARCISWQYPPIPRMTNTQIDPGESTFEELLNGIELGLFASGSMGGQTLGEIFTFSAITGRMIRKGRLAEKVSNIVVSGNLFTTLMDIDCIGNDFAVKIGNCGKGEQFPLPVTMSSPSIRITNAVVGGQ